MISRCTRRGATCHRYEEREAFQESLLETVAGSLFAYGMYERAGAFFEKLGDAHRAMEAYRKGQAYGRAVELSRRAFQARRRRSPYRIPFRRCCCCSAAQPGTTPGPRRRRARGAVGRLPRLA